MIHEDQHHQRMEQIAAAVGLELLHQDPIVAAVAHMHCRAATFELTACIVDMLKRQTEAKSGALKTARDALLRAKPLPKVTRR